MSGSFSIQETHIIRTGVRHCSFGKGVLVSETLTWSIDTGARSAPSPIGRHLDQKWRMRLQQIHKVLLKSRISHPLVATKCQAQAVAGNSWQPESGEWVAAKVWLGLVGLAGHPSQSEALCVELLLGATDPHRSRHGDMVCLALAVPDFGPPVLMIS